MRRFGTHGPVNSNDHYVVSRESKLTDYVNRVQQGRYIVLFAPRQTGKTTFFKNALTVLTNKHEDYYPLQLNFEEYNDHTATAFYADIFEDIKAEIESLMTHKNITPSQDLTEFLRSATVTDHISLRRFFRQLPNFFTSHASTNVPPRFVITIDEFDGIPNTVVSNFLHTLRRIYLSDGEVRSPYSVCIVGVKNITQLNYDRSISPFNIQDEFILPNFTHTQVRELLDQYTAEVGQNFTPDTVKMIHRQTAGQPFLVNRIAQILTDESDIPINETIEIQHFLDAHAKILEERNTNLEHLLTNIRKDKRFEKVLMKIALSEKGIRYNIRNETISELVSYGVITKRDDGQCIILNPIYLHCITQSFLPTANGLE